MVYSWVSDAEYLKEVSKITEISVDDLKIFTIPPSRNKFIVDKNSTIFTKITTMLNHHEKHGIDWMMQNKVLTPRLLSFTTFGASQILVFENVNFVGESSEPITILEQVWDTPIHDTARDASTGRKIDRFHANIENIQDFSASRKEWFIQKASTLVSALDDFEQNNSFSPVTVHGDFHQRNTGVTSTGLNYVFDWEWWGYGIREVDLSKWIQVAMSEQESYDSKLIEELLNFAENNRVNLNNLNNWVKFSALSALVYQERWQNKLEIVPKLESLLKNGLN